MDICDYSLGVVGGAALRWRGPLGLALC